MKKIITLFLVIFSINSAYASDSLSTNEGTIKLTAPAGYTDVLELSEDFKIFVSRFVPEKNQLLAYYLPDNEARKFLLPDFDYTEAAQYNRKFMLQISKDALSQPLKKEEFIILKKMISEQQSTLFKSVQDQTESLTKKAIEDTLSDLELSDIQTKLEVTNVLPLNDLLETEKSIQFGVIMKLQLDMSSSDFKYNQPDVLVAETSMPVVNGVLFYLYGYSNYASEEDITWTQKATQSWTESFLSANQHLPDFASNNKLNAGNIEKVVERGISGGLSGGLLALIVSISVMGIAWLKKIIKRK